MKIIEIKEQIKREIEAVKCDCGGYAEIIDCTKEEIKQYGCGRDRVGDECCARTFLCRICGTRLVGKAEAPECEW